MKKNFNYKYDDLFNPVLQAMHSLGGSGSAGEIEEAVIRILKLNEKEVGDIHRGTTSKLSYRLAWARNYLKRFGLMERPSARVWILTEQGRKTKQVDQEAVKRKARTEKGGTGGPEDNRTGHENNMTDPEEIKSFIWHEEVIARVLTIPPAAFERLCQLMLRELGFVNVEVTGRTNDGGIDGRGTLKVGGVLSFNIVFQAKRHAGSISSGVIRDLRGAMSGRTADRGLVITTGRFTQEARKEAGREGTVPVELIDGKDLAEKLKDLSLGVRTEMVEKISVMEDWFRNI